jgi:hypothetical protein
VFMEIGREWSHIAVLKRKEVGVLVVTLLGRLSADRQRKEEWNGMLTIEMFFWRRKL